MALQVHPYLDEFKKYINISPEEEILVHTSGKINPQKFARAMIKISYCVAISLFGFENIGNSPLPDIILGKANNMPYVFGCPPGPIPPYIDMEMLHTEHVMCVPAPAPGMFYIICRVRPFATYGSAGTGYPVYETFVGEARGDLLHGLAKSRYTE
jgi:hypothetical protein